MISFGKAASWNLFGKLFWPLWVGQLFILLAALILARASWEWALATVLLFAGYSLWMSSRVVVPLARLINKARLSGAELPFDSVRKNLDALNEREVDAELGERQPAEIGDIESALDRMQASLRTRSAELAREREELTTVMGAISDAILAIDREGNALFFNSRFVLLFGGKDFSERRSRLGEVFRAPEVLDAFQKCLKTGDNQRNEVSLRVLADSAVHDYSLSIAALRRSGGEIYGAVGIFHEVTELKLAEKIRIDFVGNVSHELRTPLTAIKGYTDTLREDIARNDYDSANRFLDALGRNVDRLMALISDLLDLSSIESSGEEATRIKKRPLHTREVTERALAQIEVARAAKKITILPNYGAPIVLADPQRLEQVLVNLLENAVKYIPDLGRVELLWQEQPDGVILQVKDNGPGIPSEHLPRLFERFYRVEQARSRDAGGTGLGLAIVKHILQAHGGTVSVVSDVGQGTVFTCRFQH